MTCPKCEEGTINKIVFKKNERVGYACDLCDAFWLEGESIGIESGHTLRSFSESEGLEYSIEELSEKDQDHWPTKKLT